MQDNSNDIVFGMRAAEPPDESVKNPEDLISLLIPVFNTEKYVGQCLKSVTDQTYRNLEIIVVDDGSTDGSGVICDEFASRDPRMHVFHTENRGVAAARNFALDRASGSYVLYLDSDDWMEPNAIETLAELSKKHGADIAMSTICREYVDRTVGIQENIGEINVFKGEEIIRAYAEKRFYELICDKLCRAECYNGIRFPDGHTFEDVAVMTVLMKTLSERRGTIVMLSEDLFHYRVRKSGITQTKSLRNICDRWTAYRTKLDLIPESTRRVTAACIQEAGSMWENYPRFSKEDKKSALPTVLEMQAFSKDNYRRVVKDKYSRITRLRCFITRLKSLPAMWTMRIAEKTLRALKKNKRNSEKLFE